MFQCRTNLDQQHLEVAFLQDLTAAHADDLQEQCFVWACSSEIKNCAWKSVEVDLAAVENVDSMGVNFLISFIQLIKKRNSKVKLKIARLHIYRLFLFVHMSEIAEVEYVGSEEETDSGIQTTE
jgi:ABC-type transporter Mla MlaB component